MSQFLPKLRYCLEAKPAETDKFCQKFKRIESIFVFFKHFIPLVTIEPRRYKVWTDLYCTLSGSHYIGTAFNNDLEECKRALESSMDGLSERFNH